MTFGFGFGVAVGAGLVTGGFVGVAFGVTFGVGFVDGVADGAAALPPSVPVLDPVRVPVGPESAVGVWEAPPCVISSGACRDWLGRSLVPTLPTVKVSPPGSRPEATATAPIATAAEAPSRPVRTGVPRRLRRAPRCGPSVPAA